MRLQSAKAVALLSWFQSMHPVWDATTDAITYSVYEDVSIHASRVGCDGLEVNS